VCTLQCWDIASFQENYYRFRLLVRPETVVFARANVLLAFILFSPCLISELRGPIAAKFCTVLGAVFNFIILVQNFGESPQKNLGPKHAKFGPISVDFKVRRRISPERKIFKIGLESFVPRFFPRWVIKVR